MRNYEGEDPPPYKLPDESKLIDKACLPPDKEIN